jgi:hypothetical protein
MSSGKWYPTLTVCRRVFGAPRALDSALTVEGSRLVRVKDSGSCMLGIYPGGEELIFDPALESQDSLVGH